MVADGDGGRGEGGGGRAGGGRGGESPPPHPKHSAVHHTRTSRGRENILKAFTRRARVTCRAFFPDELLERRGRWASLKLASSRRKSGECSLRSCPTMAPLDLKLGMGGGGRGGRWQGWKEMREGKEGRGRDEGRGGVRAGRETRGRRGEN